MSFALTFGVAVSASIDCFFAVLYCFLGAPLDTGHASLAVMLPNGVMILQFDVVDWADFAA
jgi:hypothetical protein